LAALSRVAKTDQGSGTANVSALERPSPRAEIALQESARRLFNPYRSDRLPSDCNRCAGWIPVDLDRPTRRLRAATQRMTSPFVGRTPDLLARRSLDEGGCLPRRFVTPKPWRRRKPRQRRDARAEAHRDRNHYPKRKTESLHGKILPMRERSVRRAALGYRRERLVKLVICDLRGIARVANIVISGSFAATLTSSFPSMPNPHLRFPIRRRLIVDEDGLFPGLNGAGVGHTFEPRNSLLDEMSLGQPFSAP
jgi:hypothetical protein